MSTDSPQKKGRGDYAGLYEPQQDPIAQLPWHEGMVRAFEACAAEIAHPTTSAKKDQQALWMGSFLKPGKSSHTRATFFKPEGASSTFYPAKVNANLVELSDGPLKDKHAIPHTDKDAEVSESFARESSALHSHLLWLTDLLVVLNERMVDPQNVPTIQPIISQVLEHQRRVQALLSDSLAISTTKRYVGLTRPGHKHPWWPGPEGDITENEVLPVAGRPHVSPLPQEHLLGAETAQ